MNLSSLSVLTFLQANILRALRCSHKRHGMQPSDQRERSPTDLVHVERLASLQSTPMSSGPLLALTEVSVCS